MQRRNPKRVGAPVDGRNIMRIVNIRQHQRQILLTPAQYPFQLGPAALGDFSGHKILLTLQAERLQFIPAAVHRQGGALRFQFRKLGFQFAELLQRLFA